jgi:hypothetical protein
MSSLIDMKRTPPAHLRRILSILEMNSARGSQRGRSGLGRTSRRGQGSARLETTMKSTGIA